MLIRSNAIHHHEKPPFERFLYSFPTTILSKSKNCNNMDGDVCLHPWFLVARIPRGTPKVESQETNLGIMLLTKARGIWANYSDFSLEMVVMLRESTAWKNWIQVFRNYPKVSWPLKTSYFEDLYTPAIQVHSPFHWRVQWPVRDSDLPRRIGNVQVYQTQPICNPRQPMWWRRLSMY